MATVWNPADELNCTFSNSNHTASSSSGGNQGCRAAPTSHGASGKFYLEYSAIALGGGTGSQGFGKSTDTLNGAAGQFGITDGGALYTAVGGSCGSLAASPVGHVIGMAIDFTNKKFWARYDNGGWIGDNVGPTWDPASNTHGVDISGVGFPVLPICALQVFSGTASITINSGDSAFAFTPPAGFVAWDSSVPFPYNQVRVIG